MYQARIKKLNAAIIVSLAAVFVSLGLLVTPPVSANLSIGGPSDCDNNAIIRCGVHSVNQLSNAYNGGGYIRAVYSSFGISNADMNNLAGRAVAGTVTKQGDVFVNGQLVARNAMTGGRQNMPGSTRVNVNGAVFFKRPPSVSFVSASLPAFVVMNNGRFQFAVIASCGNAVSAAAVTHKAAVGPARPVTKPHKPQPAAQAPAAPIQTQTQVQSQQVTQNQQVTVETPAAPTTPAPAQAPAAPTTLPSTGSAPAPTLPNTGAGDVFGLFSGSSLMGFLGYRRFLLRKAGQ